MPHKPGAHIGGLASDEDMRLRCVCDSHSGCWHFRTGHGKVYRPDQRQMVWLYGGETTTAARAMWAFTTGKPVPKGKVVVRTCDSHDCVQPGHLKLMARADAVRRQAKRGCFNNPRQLQNLREAVAQRRKVTLELRVWIAESPQSGVEVARCLGITQSRANAIRAAMHKRMPTAAPSIFALGAAANAQQRREAA